MYVPKHFAVSDDDVGRLLHNHGAADLVTATNDGLIATLLPFLFDPTVGEHGALLGHVARNNDHWRRPPVGEVLVIVRGPDAYVTPSWYATKTEHGRVVPTWNYVTAHVYGRLVVHDDPDWVEDLVRRLTAEARGRPAGAVVGRRRAGAVRRRPAAGDRRGGGADHPHRGQGQAQPEPVGRRHRGRHRRSRSRR